MSDGATNEHVMEWFPGSSSSTPGATSASKPDTSSDASKPAARRGRPAKSTQDKK